MPPKGQQETAPDVVGQGNDELKGLAAQFKTEVPQLPKTPVGQFGSKVSSIQNTLRQHLMETEGQLQGSLSDASKYIIESQDVETISATVTKLSNILEGGAQALSANSSQARQLLEQLKSRVADHQANLDLEVAQSLSQAISSMARAQSYMFASYSISKLDRLIVHCDHILKRYESPTQQIQ